VGIEDSEQSELTTHGLSVWREERKRLSRDSDQKAARYAELPVVTVRYTFCMLGDNVLVFRVALVSLRLNTLPNLAT